MIDIKIRKVTFRHIEAELYAYHETKKEIVRLRNDILFGSSPVDENVGGGRSSLTSDRVGLTVSRLTSDKRLIALEDIAEAINFVYMRLTEERQKLVQLRYWTKPQLLTWDGVALKLEVSRRTAINWRDEIVYAIAERVGWR